MVKNNENDDERESISFLPDNSEPERWKPAQAIERTALGSRLPEHANLAE